MIFILNLLLYDQTFIQIHLKSTLYSGIEPCGLFLTELLVRLSGWLPVHPTQNN